MVQRRFDPGLGIPGLGFSGGTEGRVQEIEGDYDLFFGGFLTLLTLVLTLVGVKASWAVEATWIHPDLEELSLETALEAS